MNKRIWKKEFIALVVIIIVAVLIVLFPKKEYRHNQIVITFGDSITSGYGLIPGQKNYTTYLSEAVNIPIINAGKFRDTTSLALLRLKEDVLNKNPDIVIIFLGGNDFLDGRSEDVIKANIETVIEQIKNIGAKIILIGGSQKLAADYEFVFQEIANKEKVDAFIPNILNGILFREDLLYDNIHPNERGHKIIADRILPALERVLKENAK